MKQIGKSGSAAWFSTMRILGMIMLGLSACQGRYTGKMESMSVAAVPTEVDELFYLAESL